MRAARVRKTSRNELRHVTSNSKRGKQKGKNDQKQRNETDEIFETNNNGFFATFKKSPMIFWTNFVALIFALIPLIGEKLEEKMARILTFCIRRRKSPVLWEDTEKEQVWVTVADEENGNDITSQVRLNEDGELPIEEIVKVFPDARGKELELFTSRDHSVPICLDSSGNNFLANAKMNFMWQTRQDRSYFLVMRKRDKPPRPPPPPPRKQRR